MITLRPLYLLLGLLLAAFAWRGRSDWVRSLFWGLLSLVFLVGDWLPEALLGALLIGLALLASRGRLDPNKGAELAEPTTEERLASAQRLGSWLFGPALLIPLLTLLSILLLRPLRLSGRPLIEPSSVTLAGLGIGCLGGLLASLRVTGRRLPLAIFEGRRLLDAMGWAATLPLLLATLGALFAASGVGSALAELLRSLLPLELRPVAVTTYAVGMALFTMVMGNAFAAFPVLTVGIGIPILVQRHHADPAAVAALGMLSGYCGTLLTPLAANYNLLPTALLGLSDPYAVIKAQAPTAVALLAVNIGLMQLLLFR